MARPLIRIPSILRKLEAYWRRYPDLRLCQIMSNFSGDYFKKHRLDHVEQIDDMFYIEDNKFERWLDEQITCKSCNSTPPEHTSMCPIGQREAEKKRSI